MVCRTGSHKHRSKKLSFQDRDPKFPQRTENRREIAQAYFDFKRISPMTNRFTSRSPIQLSTVQAGEAGIAYRSSSSSILSNAERILANRDSLQPPRVSISLCTSTYVSARKLRMYGKHHQFVTIWRNSDVTISFFQILKKNN